MHQVLETLKEQMIKERHKCIAANAGGEVVFTSQKVGIAPLLDLQKTCGENAHYICDRVFGKAAVYMAALCGAHEIYSFVASEPAILLAQELALTLYWEKKVPFIENRDGTAQCPIENCVMDCTTPAEAHQTILSRLDTLRAQQGGQ